MFDLDHFKAYNDAHGHPAGDRLLAAVAAIWAGCLRATDSLARYGGEEFALVAPGCSAEEALALVDRLRAAVPEESHVLGRASRSGTAPRPPRSCWRAPTRRSTPPRSPAATSTRSSATPRGNCSSTH